MSDVLIFVPVGVSLLENNAITSRNVNVIIQPVNHLIDRITKEIRAHSNKPKPKNPAEITSLYALRQKKVDALENKQVYIVLLCDQTVGRVCAEAIRKLLENDNYFDKPAGSIWAVASPVVMAQLDPKQPAKFLQAMHDLSHEIQNRIKNFEGEIYLNITGGYKALAPYLTLMGMALGRHVTVFYQYEDSREVIELPTYPLAFDLLEWRDGRGLLLPFAHDLGIGQDQKRQLYQALEGSKLQGLIQPDSLTLNPVGELLSHTYEQEKGVRLSEYGTGGLLLDRCPNYKSYLQDHCIPFWRHLSVGDHIPETVEHGRGHVQRLLELAQQLVLAANLQLTEDQVFVLLAGIWLHDLGHTGDYFTFEGNNGLIRDKDNPSSTSRFPTYGNPGLVREYHNFLTYELLTQEKDTLFPNPDNSRPQNDLLFRSIALASLYHRRKMPVEGQGVFKRCQVAKGFAEFQEEREVIAGFAQVAALLRFLDGVENQKERAGSNKYYEVLEWVLKRKLKFLESFTDINSREYQEYQFKTKTLKEEHFQKHQSISQVFLVPESRGGLAPKGIYPSEGDSKPIVGIYTVKSPDSFFDRDALVTKVINGVLEEFLLVRELLPFRVAFFLLVEDSNPLLRFQVIISPNRLNNPEGWEYGLEQM